MWEAAQAFYLYGTYSPPVSQRNDCVFQQNFNKLGFRIAEVTNLFHSIRLFLKCLMIDSNAVEQSNESLADIFELLPWNLRNSIQLWYSTRMTGVQDSSPKRGRVQAADGLLREVNGSVNFRHAPAGRDDIQSLLSTDTTVLGIWRTFFFPHGPGEQSLCSVEPLYILAEILKRHILDRSELYKSVGVDEA